MTGKKLVSNLKNYLDPLVEIPVYKFDRNTTRDLPCIVIGYDTEETSIKGYSGHYSVSGWVKVVYQGYEDADNTNADIAESDILDALCDRTAIETSLNVPLSGTDTRPASAFGLHRLFVRGTSREDEDHSTVATIHFDAFCVAKDF